MHSFAAQIQKHATDLTKAASAQEKLKHERWEVEIELLRRQATALSRILVGERKDQSTGMIDREREDFAMQENGKLRADIRYQAQKVIFLICEL